MRIYTNNDVSITAEAQDPYESKINVNGQNLIWVSRSELEDFKRELSDILDRYRI